MANSLHASDELPRATQPQGLAATRVDAAGATSVGRLRERNEDQFLVAVLERRLKVMSSSMGPRACRAHEPFALGTLFVVADGMGGMGGGDVASAVAVRTIAEHVGGALPRFDHVSAPPAPDSRDSLPGVRSGLVDAMARSDRNVRWAAARGHGAPRMGTTLTMAYIHFPLLYVVHVGDSRCYLIRDGSVTQLTQDHTLGARLRAEAGGGDMAATTMFDHVLWNALGPGPEHHPDVLRRRLRPGDAVVLCSDGLIRHVGDEGIARAVESAPDAAAASERLVAAANADGGSDNVTVVVARCSDSGS